MIGNTVLFKFAISDEFKDAAFHARREINSWIEKGGREGIQWMMNELKKTPRVHAEKYYQTNEVVYYVHVDLTPNEQVYWKLRYE